MNLMCVSGNLGRDMEIRMTQNGKAVGNFPLPVKQGYGEHEKVSWIDCKVLGERANKLQQYLTKGKEVTVSGEFVLEQWEKDGVKHSRPVIIVDKLDMHGGNQSGNTTGNARNAEPARAAEPAGGNQQWGDNYDDSIPF